MEKSTVSSETIREPLKKKQKVNTNNVSWADSLSKNIIKSVTLEIGNPIDDGYDYIKQVHTMKELKK